MTLFDLLIIYSACGAPFGVYYFLHYRKRSVSKQIWFKTILTFLFWIPFAYKLLRNGKIKRKLFHLRFNVGNDSEPEMDKRLFSIGQQIEKLFLEIRYPISIYEVREVFERYSGLILAYKNPNRANNQFATEFFRIAGRENVKLGAICVERRNQKRLEFHQTQAREDFLKLLGNLATKTAQIKKLEFLTIQFVKTLKDETTIREIKKLFSSALQTDKNLPVNALEKDLWKAAIHKPQTAKQLSITLPNLKATTNSYSKD